MCCLHNNLRDLDEYLLYGRITFNEWDILDLGTHHQWLMCPHGGLHNRCHRLNSRIFKDSSAYGNLGLIIHSLMSMSSIRSLTPTPDL